MRLAIFALAITALGALPALAASGACLKRGEPILQALTRQIRRANATASLAVHDSVLWACKKDRLQEYLRSSAVARSGGQRLIVVIVDDYDGPLLSDERLVLLRTSVNPRQMKDTELVLPYLFEPLPSPFPPKPRGDRPIVGFCGRKKSRGGNEREALLDALELASRGGLINASFVLQSKFWGGNPGDPSLVAKFRSNMEEARSASLACGESDQPTLSFAPD